MRIRAQKQLYFKPQSQENRKNDKIKTMINILMSLPEYEEILGKICRDLSTGTKGMTAEQVLICFIVRDMNQISYRELEYLTSDSNMLREILNLGFCHNKIIK